MHVYSLCHPPLILCHWPAATFHRIFGSRVRCGHDLATASRKRAHAHCRCYRRWDRVGTPMALHISRDVCLSLDAGIRFGRRLSMAAGFRFTSSKMGTARELNPCGFLAPSMRAPKQLAGGGTRYTTSSCFEIVVDVSVSFVRDFGIYSPHDGYGSSNHYQPYFGWVASDYPQCHLYGSRPADICNQA